MAHFVFKCNKEDYLSMSNPFIHWTTRPKLNQRFDTLPSGDVEFNI